MIPLGYGVMLITRAEWGARPPRSVTRLSASLDTCHWEGPTMGDFPHSSCASKVRGIQNFHMDSKGWTDIAYNNLACPHGYVFEGRGRGTRSAANGTTAGNDGSYATCYLGGQGDGFTEDGKRAMKASGDHLTWVGSGRRCHRDWKPTECPGDEICGWVKAGQPVGDTPQQPKDWFDMATQADLEAVVRKLGPWLGIVKGDPTGALFAFDGGTRTWLGSQEAVHLQTTFFNNLHTDNGKPFTPTPEEARGFFLANREELEAHIGGPYTF